MMVENSGAERPFQTTGVHGGGEQNPSHGVSSPIFQSSTFHFSNPAEMAEAMVTTAHPQFYGRYATPNTKQVESVIAELELGEGAIATASGMAAISLIMLGLLKAGDHLVAQRVIYPTSYNLLRKVMVKLGIEVTFVDQDDLKAFAGAVKANTRLIYVESPANPIMSLTDLKGIATLAQERHLLTVVDNTFATPFNQRPLEIGCDIVVHSATKYLSGHSDVVAGAVVSNQEIIEKLWRKHIILGAVLHPFEAWLLARGLKTFGLRMERHNANGLAVAEFLSQHPAVTEVFYPGLESHPQYGLARTQMLGGFGGMLSFRIAGNETEVFKVLEKFELICLATSLGGVHSLISHPQTTVSAVQSVEVRNRVGVDASLLRLSVGLEDLSDIIADLDRALPRS